ncbi:MAG TPA: alternative ribosome rescue aminoacyl-tRNA hydrolase ArfB [Acidimicrobiales bacterium]|nr:alternative ribosome rescue aminoacyl-tRNA hydrolase ArfB [Acidimicrobiales bacterium]
MPDEKEADRAPPDAGPSAVLRVSPSLTIPLEEISWRATTPGGPGGQHANRTASRVEVRFDAEHSPSIGPRQRALIVERLGPVVTASSGDERSQARNRQLALDRLANRLAAALRVPRRRRPTAPSAASKARRLDEKRRRSVTKEGRRAARADDE